ncbi:arm repeat-containing protein [Phaffia rhodozyma]|uniref:Arm repeat-containing protein n=1 Tax=Phaffia rhodozyma TaxID=264483 RepID=A0A0F7SLL4_PHARH|nr:arm repeat-containing protein [Phaffia rhodozyma]
MGNLPARAVNAPRPSTTLDSYVEELGKDVVYEQSIGTSRFLKTIKGRHRNGPLLIKIFIKNEPIPFIVWRRRLKADKEILENAPNISPYVAIVETENAAYLVRQYLASDLYDRISTRPFLANIEKKWLTYQILRGMQELRSRKVSHGDLKPSNVLVTTSNWALITDLAPFKPVYIPEDDPADFSFFFDMSQRRSCYLAPERFYASGTKAEKKRAESSLEEGKRDGKVTEQMDVFSAGCTICELWLEGKDMFSLSGMLGWRKGESSPEAVLSEIPDLGIQAMVRQMTSLEPSSRPSFEQLLESNRGTTLSEFFYSFFHPYNVTLQENLSPLAFIRTYAPLNEELGLGQEDELPSDSDQRIDRLKMDMGDIKHQLDIHRDQGGEEVSKDIITEDGLALLVLALITSNIRSCRRPSSKTNAIDIMAELCVYLSDESKLDRVCPFLVVLLSDEAPGVRAASIHALAQMLEGITVVTPSNMAVVTEYILPNAWHLAKDEEVSVRIAYASSMGSLTETGSRFLEISESFRSRGGTAVFSEETDEHAAFNETTYEESKEELHRIIQNEVSSLLSDPSPAVKRAVLAHITTFCLFFGRSKTNEVVLSHMFTYLNDADWMLREAFFESVVGVAAFVGAGSLEMFIFPMMIEALLDPEESVVARVIASFQSLVELDLFRRPRLWELLGKSYPFLSHPNVWIRQSTAGLVATASRHLSTADTWCILYPKLRPYLASEVSTLSEESILDALLPPVTRATFDERRGRKRPSS